jgi:uncharacterized protein
MTPCHQDPAPSSDPGPERLPGPDDSGKIAVEEVIHRLLVEGVSARNAAAYFDRTYHDDIYIHEAPSLPYGGDYHGLEGAARHASRFTETWDRWQTGEQRQLDPRIIATDTEAVVLWTLRAQQPGEPEESRFPAISHYCFRDGRVVESRMFFYDTTAVLDFLIRAESSRLA